MMNDFLTPECRKQYGCTLVDGSWKCRCGSVLAPDDVVACPACLERSRIEREKRELAERRREWESSLLARVRRTLAQLPAWPHVASREAFAAAVSVPILRRVAETYQLENGSLLALGLSGQGKTSLCARVVTRLVGSAMDARIADPKDEGAKKRFQAATGIVWTTGSAIARALREHRLGSGDEPELITLAVEAPLLVCDELGPEPPQRAGEIFDVVDRRYGAGLPTLVTSGLSLEAFTERYGDAFRRRLTETGRGTLIDGHPRRTDG